MCVCVLPSKLTAEDRNPALNLPTAGTDGIKQASLADVQIQGINCGSKWGSPSLVRGHS